jgi:hypothetical protein
MPSAPGSSISVVQTAMVVVFAVGVGLNVQWVYSTAPQRSADVGTPGASQPEMSIDPAEVERCKVPDFAKAIGHEEKWKLHNNCK